LHAAALIRLHAGAACPSSVHRIRAVRPNRLKEDSHMSTSDVHTIQDAYAAFARQDIPTVLEAFDKQIEWYSPDELPMGGTYRGHDGVVQFFQSLPGYYDELRVEPDGVVQAGDERVLAYGHLRGRIAGEEFEAGFAHLWTMRGGTAVRFREYNDSGKLLPLLERVAAA
jgi:ketosteroid isomerase-like protein